MVRVFDDIHSLTNTLAGGAERSLAAPGVGRKKVSRRMDLRWKEGLIEVITAGVSDGSFKCEDPHGSAWRINCLVDGLAVQLMVHDKVISRRQAAATAACFAMDASGLCANQGPGAHATPLPGVWW